MRKTIDRRQLLHGLAASGLVAPLLKTMPLWAADAPAPSKVIFVSAPGPWHLSRSEMLGGGDFGSALTYGEKQITDNDAIPEGLQTIGLTAAKLDLYRRSTTYFGGLNLTGLSSRCSSVGAHRIAAAILTGACNYQNEAENFHPTSESVDQYLARRLGVPVLGMGIPFPDSATEPADGYFSYQRPDTPGSRAVRFIPHYSAQSALQAIQPTTVAAGLDAGVQRRILLDSAERDIAALKQRLPDSDRERLQLHVNRLTALRDAIAAPRGNGNCGAGFSPPTRDAYNPTLLYDTMMDYSRIMVEALACGYTRVGFIQWHHLTGANHRINMPQFSVTSQVVGPNYNQNLTWHGLAHLSAGIGGAGTSFAEGNTVPAQLRDLGRPKAIRANQAINTHLAELLSLLDATPDVGGGSMLDNTLVVFFRPMGTNHDARQVGWVVAGGKNLGVRGGRAVRLPGQQSGSRVEGQRYQSDMLVAICRAMGLSDVSSFGLSDFNTTPIAL